ncbi:unnamed protein product [Amoebophrya sp. A25]|nr:unnamed protein product [Amoebophrya sp. A25]|eukprot:GSA25T00009256001.1
MTKKVKAEQLEEHGKQQEQDRRDKKKRKVLQLRESEGSEDAQVHEALQPGAPAGSGLMQSSMVVKIKLPEEDFNFTEENQDLLVSASAQAEDNKLKAIFGNRQEVAASPNKASVVVKDQPFLKLQRSATVHHGPPLSRETCAGGNSLSSFGAASSSGSAAVHVSFCKVERGVSTKVEQGQAEGAEIGKEASRTEQIGEPMKASCSAEIEQRPSVPEPEQVATEPEQARTTEVVKQEALARSAETQANAAASSTHEGPGATDEITGNTAPAAAVVQSSETANIMAATEDVHQDPPSSSIAKTDEPNQPTEQAARLEKVDSLPQFGEPLPDSLGYNPGEPLPEGESQFGNALPDSLGFPDQDGVGDQLVNGQDGAAAEAVGMNSAAQQTTGPHVGDGEQETGGGTNLSTSVGTQTENAAEESSCRREGQVGVCSQGFPNLLRPRQVHIHVHVAAGQQQQGMLAPPPDQHELQGLQQNQQSLLNNQASTSSSTPLNNQASSSSSSRPNAKPGNSSFVRARGKDPCWGFIQDIPGLHELAANPNHEYCHNVLSDKNDKKPRTYQIRLTTVKRYAMDPVNAVPGYIQERCGENHDLIYHCTCEAWKFRTGPIYEKGCKHIWRLLGYSESEFPEAKRSRATSRSRSNSSTSQRLSTSGKGGKGGGKGKGGRRGGRGGQERFSGGNESDASSRSASTSRPTTGRQGQRGGRREVAPTSHGVGGSSGSRDDSRGSGTVKREQTTVSSPAVLGGESQSRPLLDESEDGRSATAASSTTEVLPGGGRGRAGGRSNSQARVPVSSRTRASKARKTSEAAPSAAGFVAEGDPGDPIEEEGSD